MNTISGRIVLARTTLGIPNLLAVLFDVDPDTRPEEAIASLSAITRSASSTGTMLGGLGDRIGSVVTDSTGSFALSYEDSEFQIRNEGEKRPDLLLLVLAPEAPGRTLNELVLFASSEVRQNAGRIEGYFVELTAEELARAGIPTPVAETAATDDTGEQDLKQLERRLQTGRQYFDRKAELLSAHVDVAHAEYAAVRTSTFSADLKESLSQVPKAVREGPRFVRDTESIGQKVFNNMVADIQETFVGPPGPQKPVSRGYLYMTEAEATAWAPFIQGEDFVLPPDIVERDILPRLFRGNAKDGTAADFLMDHPAVRLCMREMKRDVVCAAGAHGGNGHGETPAEPEEPGVGPELSPAAPGDVFLYVARQMQHAMAPEGLVNFGIDPKPRATAPEIGAHIGGLQFQKGPADTPSYFDFHKLQIAFEHVWKEATDLGILADGEALYDTVVSTGHKPTRLQDLLSHVGSVVRFLTNAPMQEQAEPPIEVVFEFPDTVAVWSKMTATEKTAMAKIADIILGKYPGGLIGSVTGPWKKYLTTSDTPAPYLDKEHLIDNGGFEVMGAFRQRGQQIIENVAGRIENDEELKSTLDNYQKASDLAGRLNQQLQGRYSFTYFAADRMERSINFGVLLTYRQKWDPVDYQAGELVRTIPLAPKEVRKYSKRTVVKTSRARKEIEDNLRITKTDRADTSRAESEIITKALNKNTFALNTESTFDIPLGKDTKIGNTVKSNTTQEAQRESNQTKKDFREAVVKAAQEYKSERRVEITTESTSEVETTESGEITNPNDELTCTYLFYELQRQFRINERLHRMRPVVLVAQEMPAPHEIDDGWIVRHDWMIKRALMDDSFVPAFDCVTSVRGDRLMLSELERTVLEQRKIIRDLRQNVKFYTDETGRLSRLLQAAINKEAAIIDDRDIWDGIPIVGGRLDAAESAIKGVGSLLGFGKGDDPKEAQRIRREGVKDAYERADRERRELLGRLERETDVLNGLTRQVAEKKKEINEKEVLIARLKNHLKDHILHYMQAIWSYEHPDQRFFRLFATKVPQPVAGAAQYNLRIRVEPDPAAAYEEVVNLGVTGPARKSRHAFTCTPIMTLQEKTLEEVAELDNLLGFKGNYMIFPLKQSNVLTDFMMAPYVDSEFGLLDPDAPGNWTLEEFDQLYCCLKHELGDRFAGIEPQLKEFYRQILLDPLRPGELITVPTGSLFIEALPGEHPVLEDFKALHRAVDVKKVQAEVRKLELENIRYAARILQGEREDPDVEKRIIVEGSSGVIVGPEPA